MDFESPEFQTTVERLLSRLQSEDCVSPEEFQHARKFHALPLGLDLWSLTFLTPDGEVIWAGWEPLEIKRSRFEGHVHAAMRMAGERFPDMKQFVR
jgi:hypothetical protein